MVKPERKLATKLHFNRVNMQRKDPRVWSAKNSRACHQATKLIIKHNGEIIAETVYEPEARQPRAYFAVRASIKYKGDVAIVEI